MGGVLVAGINYTNRFSFLDRIQSGMCPNFYLSGKSIGLLENTAMEIAKIIEKKKLIDFRGLTTCFSILMPYYDSMNSAEQFMNRLMDSYSIARDCYDLYKGILIIDCSEEWSEFGYNCTLEMLASFIGFHEEICFIILMPEKKASKYRDSLFGEFTKHQLWLRYECETLDIQECIAMFCREAESIGYSLNNEAIHKLENLLQERSEFLTDNKTAVLQLLKQIQLNKILQSRGNNQIVEKDFSIISGLSNKSSGAGIGFNSKVR